MYAFSENFILPISHDEVVHLKRSMIGKMWGEYEQKFAELKTFFGFMMAHPGKKLMFMGQEFAQFDEWNEKESLQWNLLDYPYHKTFKEFVKAINHFYLSHSEFWEIDFSWEGFKWITHEDDKNSVIAFSRKNKKGEEIIAVCNFTPVERKNYRIGVNLSGRYKPVFSTDWEIFAGKTPEKMPSVRSTKTAINGYENSVCLDIPPTSVTYYKKTKHKK